MKCSKCGRAVPEDAIYCPHCTGDRKTTDRDVIRGGVRGGLLGLLVGAAMTIAAIIAEGQAAGLWRTDLEATLMAKAVFGVLDEMATDWVLSRRNTRLQARAEAVTAFVTGALRPLA